MACTLSGCIPCAYKLVVQPFIKHEQPVQAEPSARRMHPHASSIKLASCSKLAAASDLAALLPKSSILTVGDGDLTFSINRTREVSDMGCRHLCLEMHVEEREGGGDGRERSAGAGGADASATKGGHDRQAERGGEETAEQQQQQSGEERGCVLDKAGVHELEEEVVVCDGMIRLSDKILDSICKLLLLG
ncbi:hypothetical protein GUITHDRAFT_99237 [Guillardia theta CCMP2712]|uniref:Uncharacterized protein n=1 Tax=Guillardia theta (strain CCMP2712) TaxID=905079 RepID=L1K4R8_GUITC|nr:hypothetical protein GUITHDRAFT_99237 [Guillardia theta CCMP2712]EKX55460.1 hypothetical protein GUITHDRAFT_99237 [Guillardia theta CCMP2712]|eukprot:XP_005842440.1 hypothetical protein GUITHDRAFT_99237 [Guillardia theta CCMP2712]